MARKEIHLGTEDYRGDPHAPNEQEMEEMGSLPLRPVEAHYILVNRDKQLSPDQRRALQEINDQDDEGVEIDYIDTLRRIQSEGDDY